MPISRNEMNEYWHSVIKTKNNGLMSLARQHIQAHWSWVTCVVNTKESGEREILVRISEDDYYRESDDAEAIEREMKLLSKGYLRGSFDMLNETKNQ